MGKNVDGVEVRREVMSEGGLREESKGVSM